MESKLSLKIRRYLTAHEFASNLRKLHAFRDVHIGNSLLEFLESSGLLKPRIRLQWPDPVARRFWLDRHGDVKSLHDPIEPDGQRWNAAFRLSGSLQRVGFSLQHIVHPFDDPEAELVEFIQTADRQVFLSHENRRVSVAHDSCPVLFDSSNISDYYSGWQVLTAAEVADIGVHIRTNMADCATAERVRLDLREGRLPKGYVFELFDPVRARSGFEEHEGPLDAIVWSVEEANRAVTRMLSGRGGGRIQLTEAEGEIYRAERKKAALSGLERYGVSEDALLEVCKFLSGRWAVWNSEGRSIICQAYRIYLAAAVRLLQNGYEVQLEDIIASVGYQSNHRTPTLRAIWPDWADEQKQRVIRTLRPTTDNQDIGALTVEGVSDFANFLENEYQDAIFLRLESFEGYAFGDEEVSMAGMLSDLQGMAVAVEHCVRAMGGSKGQLFQMFQQLWSDPDVSRLLKRHKKLAEQAIPQSGWSQFKEKVDTLRSLGGAESVAADLIVAHRLRASVHHSLPEDNQFELEKLFVGLLRAAATTHAHVAGVRAKEAT